MSNFPPTVTRAIVSTTEWLQEREPWVVQGDVYQLSSRLQAISARAYAVSQTTDFPKRARRDIIQVAAYLPPAVRMGFLISMAENHPDALDEILAGKYDLRSEPSRHNIFATMGSFARRALLGDIFSDDRLERVEAMLNGGGRVDQ